MLLGLVLALVLLSKVRRLRILAGFGLLAGLPGIKVVTSSDSPLYLQAVALGSLALWLFLLVWRLPDLWRSQRLETFDQLRLKKG